jgi:hypothetical protein
MAIIPISSYSGSVAGTNWAPAFNALIDANKAKGCVILLDQDTQLESIVAFPNHTVGSSIVYAPWEIRGEPGSIVRVGKEGGAKPTFAIWTGGNIQSMKLNQVHFTSSPTADFYDATQDAIQMIGLDYNIVHDCIFAGIHVPSEKAVLKLSSAICDVRNSTFGGCGGGGTNSAVLRAGGLGVNIENCWFIDYQNLRETYYGKGGYCTYWVEATFPDAYVSSANTPSFRLFNCRFDEGTQAVHVDNYKHVLIEQCRHNSNTIPNSGSFVIENCESVKLIQCHVGYPASPFEVAAATFTNCREVLIDGLTFNEHELNLTRKVVIDADTKLVVRNSPGIVIDAAAGAEYEVDGVRYRGGRTQMGA